MTAPGYLPLLRALSEAGVEFIIGGGVACVLHGVERLTMDVDVSVHMTPENLTRFLGVMTSLGLQPVAPVPASILLDPVQVRRLVEEKNALVFSFIDPDIPLRQLDLFLLPEMGYEGLLPDSEWLEVGSLSLRVVNRARLLTIKKAITPPRLKDLLDIEALGKDHSQA